MNLTELICRLRAEAEKTNATPNYLRIAADVIEHLQEERTGLIEANTTLQKTLFKVEDKLCVCQSQIPPTDEEGQCKTCKHFVSCSLANQALYKFNLEKCPEYKEEMK